MFIVLIVQNAFQLYLIFTLTKNSLQVNISTKFSTKPLFFKKNLSNHSLPLLNDEVHTFAEI